VSIELFLVEQLEGFADVYRAPLPQKSALPAITYQRISTVRGYAHDGDELLLTVRMQVDCWAATPDDADTLAEAVTGALSGYSDDYAQRIEVADDREFGEEEVDIGRRIVDLLITYRPSEGFGS
jgi:hypothetical protein